MDAQHQNNEEEEVQRYGNYEIVKPIGKGKFAVVYKAKRVDTGEEVALKRINVDSIDDKARDKCLKEVRLLQNLDHPNIIKYLDSFITENDLVIVVEWAAAGELKRQIRKSIEKGVGFDERIIWKYFSQIADAIQHMHEKRTMHRDLKPANIFLTLDGTIKVGDLGLSRELSEHTMQAHSKVGTPLYMSPEVIRGDGYDFKSDIWSLGCLLYELAMLKSPFRAEGMNYYALFEKISKADYQPLPENYSEELRSLTYSMLSIHPEDRPDMEYICDVSRRMRALTQEKYMQSKRGHGASATNSTSTLVKTNSSSNLDNGHIEPNRNYLDQKEEKNTGTIHFTQEKKDDPVMLTRKDSRSEGQNVNSEEFTSARPKNEFIGKHIVGDKFVEGRLESDAARVQLEDDSRLYDRNKAISHSPPSVPSQPISYIRPKDRSSKSEIDHSSKQRHSSNLNREYSTTMTKETLWNDDELSKLSLISFLMPIVDRIWSILIVLDCPLIHASASSRNKDRKTRASTLDQWKFVMDNDLMKKVIGGGGGSVLKQATYGTSFSQMVDLTIWIAEFCMSFLEERLKLKLEMILKNIFLDRDPPPMITKQLFSILEILNISLDDITPTQLIGGYGEKPCNFLLALAEKALELSKFKPRPLVYGNAAIDAMDTPGDDNNNDIEDEADIEEEDLASRDVEDSLDEDDGESGDSLTPGLAMSMILPSIDPLLWKEETERTSALLNHQAKLLQESQEGWGNHILQLSRYQKEWLDVSGKHGNVQEVILQQIRAMARSISQDLQLIQRIEKNLSSGISMNEHISGYKTLKKDLEGLELKISGINQRNEKLTEDLNRILEKLSEENDRLEDILPDENSSTSGVVKYKSAITQIRGEIKTMDISIAIITASILSIRQEHAKRYFQEKARQKMKRKSGKKLVDDDLLDTSI